MSLLTQCWITGCNVDLTFCAIWDQYYCSCIYVPCFWSHRCNSWTNSALVCVINSLLCLTNNSYNYSQPMCCHKQVTVSASKTICHADSLCPHFLFIYKIIESGLSVCTRLTLKQCDIWRRNVWCRHISCVRRTWAGSNVDRGHHREENCTF